MSTTPSQTFPFSKKVRSWFTLPTHQSNQLGTHTAFVGLKASPTYLERFVIEEGRTNVELTRLHKIALQDTKQAKRAEKPRAQNETNENKPITTLVITCLSVL